jgi:hypothetical protein
MQWPWRSLCIAVLLLGADSATAQQDAEAPEAMPSGPGRDETFHFCTGCHSAMIIRRQGMSRERWDATLTWMTERHGMPPLEGKERALILDYLAQAFPPRNAPACSPFLTGK